MSSEAAKDNERLEWIEPIVESLDVRATESNWGITGNDGFGGNDSAS